ncbi:MAG: hypothetical protein JRH18_11070 [Deltaproteobacteria bacterium]|nr:hypothetical protein [Deltaproteobacteria bacterium]MBW2152198.1 hypothetical protein [Deltaproteobacteria bacterium]
MTTLTFAIVTCSKNHYPPYQVVFENAPYRPESVLPVDFFPFGIGPTVVRNPHFTEPALELSRLCRNFGLETEPILLQGYLLQHLFENKKTTAASRKTTLIENGEKSGTKKRTRSIITHKPTGLPA